MKLPASAYLAANDLPARWRSSGAFVVLETDFAHAAGFFACWQAWRDAAPPSDHHGGSQTTRLTRQLHVLAIAPQMPSADALRLRVAGVAVQKPSAPALSASTDATTPRLPAAAPVPTQPPAAAMTDELLAAWPPAVPGLHRLAFDGGDVQLLIAAGSVRTWLPQLDARVDAFFIAARTLSDDADPSWPLRLFKACGRLAAPGASLVMPEANDAARAALRTAGFRLSDAGAGRSTAAAAGATDNLWCARHAPDFAPRRAAGRRAQVRAPLPIAVVPGGNGCGQTASSGPAAAARPPAERRALIIGAGLAGCATAWALAERGWHSTLLDRQDAPACEASGNPGGLVHGVVHPRDGAHARFNRAAALETQRAVRVAIDRHGVAGDTGGVLRIEAAPASTLAALQAIIRDSGLSADYVRAVDAAEASALAGIPIAHPCWHYPGGGWVDPAGLARSFVERGGSRIRFRGGTAVAALRRCDGDPTATSTEAQSERSLRADGLARDAGWPRWQLIDAAGRVLGESTVVVLAHAGDASVLLGGPAPGAGKPLPALSPITRLQSVRGQLSRLPIDALASALPGLELPRLPLTGAGWLLPAVDGCAVFGATAQRGDGEPAVRESDHALNLSALGRLVGVHVAGVPPALLGRTAWRCATSDRLPLIGAVPAVREADGHHTRCADSRPASGNTVDSGASLACAHIDRVARLPGLYTFSALGSRGITWAALGGQLVASLIAGTPLPVGRRLMEAVDPGRFIVRERRRVPHW